MNLDQEKAFEQILVASLARVNEWLRYAETKIAAVVTFCSAWLVAMGNMTFGTDKLETVTRGAFALSSPFVFIALLLALYGAFPRLNLAVNFRSKKAASQPTGSRNLLYFGDIKEVSTKELFQALRDKYEPKSTELHRSEYLADLSVQISANSKIAYTKFLLCNWAVFFMAVAIVVFAAFAFVGPAREWAMAVFS